MLVKKKKHRPPPDLSFKLSDFGVAATGSTIPVTISPSAAATSLYASGYDTFTNSGSVIDSVSNLKEFAPSPLKSLLPPHVEVSKLSGGSTAINIDSKSLENVDSQARNYAALLKSSAQLQEMGTPSEHVSVRRSGAQRASLKVLLASPKAGKPLLKHKEEGLSLAQATPQIRKSNVDGLMLNGAISNAHSSQTEAKDQSSDQEGSRIVIVWDPKVTMLIYNTTAQLVTCGVTILSENITLTVTFVYGFNLVEDRNSLWESLVELQLGSPVGTHPWTLSCLQP
ncbi:BnaC04g55980D [Brassica napus]|uniref:BnaC04g55980D protein n=1 Tax=Brassica napus TaxID=3708 RepID=A0A078J043_BRANA|nr:BnaC04g55980D [Brassica napus]